MSVSAPLDSATIEAIAREVAKVLDRPPEAGLLNARDVAARFHVQLGWVYAHADELGVIRLGSGTRPRLRFDAAIVAHQLLPRPVGQASSPRPRSERGPAPLLPIRPTPSRRTLGTA